MRTLGVRLLETFAQSTHALRSGHVDYYHPVHIYIYNGMKYCTLKIKVQHMRSTSTQSPNPQLDKVQIM